MKLLIALLCSSVLLLGACGTSNSNLDDGTKTSDNEVQDDVEGNENPTTEQGESGSDSSDQASTEVPMDQWDFTYNPEEIKEFELNIELLTNEEWDYDFDREDQEAEIEHENGSDTKKSGREAFQEIEALLAAIKIDHERSINEMIDELVDYLALNREDLEKIDLALETYSGEELGFKYHTAKGNQSNVVNELDLDIEFLSGEEWAYEYELNDQDFSIEYSDQNDLHGEDAKTEMEDILSEVTIDLDQSLGTLAGDFLTAIDRDFSELKEWSFEVEFEDQMKLAVKFDRY